jgi:ABC-type branched-subunit amino acid transport system ATPase component
VVEDVTQATGPILQLDEISVHFGALKAVDGVSMAVRPGQVIGLIGPNGAGKTTVMNAIFGVRHPTTGRIVLDGQDLGRKPPHIRARLGMTRTFQNLELFASMTVFENVMTHVDAITGRGRPGDTRLSRTERRDRALAALDSVGMAGISDRTVNELSYPERKLVEFARAVAVDAKVVLLDEPAAGIAVEERTDVVARMGTHLQRGGVSGIVVEHDMQVIRSLCDTVYVLDSGRVIASGHIDELMHDARVREAYLG